MHLIIILTDETEQKSGQRFLILCPPQYDSINITANTSLWDSLVKGICRVKEVCVQWSFTFKMVVNLAQVHFSMPQSTLII